MHTGCNQQKQGRTEANATAHREPNVLRKSYFETGRRSGPHATTKFVLERNQVEDGMKSCISSGGFGGRRWFRYPVCVLAASKSKLRREVRERD
mmetsp:Transcript_16482/g.38246  ORF Transcript_16482/g.38246 Transcript_16482/m.38246 type:complete len:94 (-) Transcript_16482:426-707(-)